MWELYEKRINLHGRSPKERLINEAKSHIASQTPYTPGSERISVNGVEMDALITSSGLSSAGDSRDGSLSRKNLSVVHSIKLKLGDVVVWNSKQWFIVDIDMSDVVYQKAVIMMCNKVFRWQDEITGEMHAVSGIINKVLSQGIAVDQVISAPKQSYEVMIPLDTHSAKIDIGKRFLVDKLNNKAKAYIVTDVDTVTYVIDDAGLLVWTMERCAFNPETDDVVQMIADYKKVPELPPLGTAYISIDGNLSVRVKGLANTYVAKLTGPDGVEISDAQIAWTIDVEEKYREYILTEVAGNSIVIRCNNSIMAGRTFTLIASDSLGVHTPETKKIKVVGLI